MEEYQQQEETLHLRDYWGVVWKRLWLILAVFVIVVVTTLIMSLRTKPVYKATAQVLIERENPKVVKVDQVTNTEANWMDYYPTQYKVLESRSLAKQVVQELQLDKHPEFNPEPDTGFSIFDVTAAVASMVRAVIPKGKSEASPVTPEEAGDLVASYISAYLGRLRIEPIRNSRLVNIAVEAHDPALAARMANAHAQAYIKKDMEMKLSASQDAAGWLSGRQEDLKKTLQTSEEALQRFHEQEDIVALESLLAGGETGKAVDSVLAQKLADIHSNLTPVRTERIGLEAMHRELLDLSKNPALLEVAPQVTQSTLIQGLKSTHAELTRQSLELREKYGEKHPRMIALQEEIKNIRAYIADETKKVVKSVEIQYRVAQAKEQNLLSMLEQTKKEVNELNRKAIRYGELKREVESNRQLFDMVLKRGKETALTSVLESTNILIVDKAEVPRAPVRPQTARNVMLAVLIGLVLGLGVAFFFEYLDNTIHGPNEVKRYLGVPFLGPVGLAAFQEGGTQQELVVLQDSRSHFAESLRNVRTNVLFSFTEAEQNAVVITSPGPLEGKTLISSNLAMIMAQMGRRVLLVDADMRKPRVHKVFGTASEPGLSNLVLGKCSVEQAIRDTRVKLLKVLPAGTVPPNPSEILSSRRMQDLLAQLKGQFEFVVFDTPPILSATDATMLGGLADGVILVVKASETTRDSAQRALEHLSDVRARVLGAVLNQVDFQKERYYYGYYYRYYYYYTDDGDRQRRRGRARRRTHRRYGIERAESTPELTAKRKEQEPGNRP